jgi:hypothetical protein
MVKIKYRGPKLFEPEMKEIKDIVAALKKDVKGLRCSSHHSDRYNIIHLRYIKETGELEKHVNACCYEFQNILKERLPELHQELK